MRTIYPKLITTLFFILLAAMVARFAVAADKPQSTTPHTSHPQPQASK